ncbi:hypothetical protein T4D_5988 [Trichinella pseudospiralis]|uniref:Uncharacterized protein n=1 Tax=Trichinella pseudospiralis TaxID=6337 RepID=A0A0V1FEF3_TRIPS|nr:hypothetical protein T4D_5988 [Trichinella pseudospiralis]
MIGGKVPNANVRATQLPPTAVNLTKRQQIEQQRLRETILLVVVQLEVDSSESAVRNALHALDAQSAEAHRAPVALEDVLPDGESLEAALNECRELRKEVFTTRTCADTFLKEKDKSKQVSGEACLDRKIGTAVAAEKACNQPLPRAGSSVSSARLLARPSLFGDEPLYSSSFSAGIIPSARSMSAAGCNPCQSLTVTSWSSSRSGINLRRALIDERTLAIERITVCAENYSEVVRTLHNRFYRVPEVVASHVLEVVGLKECSEDGAAELTRLHDGLNRHFLELRALGKET